MKGRVGSWRVGLLMLAVSTALLTLILGLGCGFYYDDFWNLDQAHRLGWGWGLLGRPVFGHVNPLTNAAIGLVAGPGGGRWAVALGMLVLFAAPVPVAAAWAARRLGADEPASLVAGALTAASAALGSIDSWWSAGIYLYPSIVAGCAIVGGFGLVRSGRRIGLVIAVVGLAVGLGLTEGVLVVLLAPAVVAAMGGRSRAGSLARLRSTWGPPRRWAWFALPIVGALVVRASAAAPIEQYPRSPFLSLAGFAPVFLFRGFVPSLVGLTAGRVDVLGSSLLTTVVGVVAVGGIGMVLRSRLRPGVAVPAIAAVVAAVLARALMVGWSRLALLGWHDTIEVRYWVDLVWLVPVLLAPAWLPAPVRVPRRLGAGPSKPEVAGDVRSDEFPPPTAPRAAAAWAISPSAAAVAIGALIVAGLVGQVAVSAQAPSRTSRRYLDAARSSWGSRPAEAVALDTLVPAAVLGPQFGAGTFLSRTVVRADLPLDFGPSDALVAPDERGRFREVTLGPLTTLDVAAAFTATDAPGVAHEGACWVAGAQGAVVWVPLTRPLTLGPYVLDLQMSGPSDRHVAFLAAGTVPSAYLGASQVGRGGDRWLVASTPFQGTQIGFELRAGARLCLASGQVSLPVAAP